MTKPREDASVATILVVDDVPTNRRVLVRLLDCRGHRVLEASDGQEALAVVRAQHPDLVITDILMPAMDGYEFVRQLRSDPAIAQTRVIFYSAHVSVHRRERRARGEGNSCLSRRKPGLL